MTEGVAYGVNHLGGVGSLLSKWCSRMRGIVVKLKRARRFGAIVTGFGSMATSADAGSSSQCLVRRLHHSAARGTRRINGKLMLGALARSGVITETAM